MGGGGVKGDNSSFVKLKNDEEKTISNITKRMELLTKFPESHGGQLMIISYDVGGIFNPHFDFHKETVMGDRVAQMLLYLNDVEEGGETTFPTIGIKVIPQRGRALLWYNVENMSLPKDNDTNPKIPTELINHPYSLHTGNAIIKGEKWVASKTFHSVAIKSEDD